jgi:hypothetical protein
MAEIVHVTHDMDNLRGITWKDIGIRKTAFIIALNAIAGLNGAM